MNLKKILLTVVAVTAILGNSSFADIPVYAEDENVEGNTIATAIDISSGQPYTDITADIYGVTNDSKYYVYNATANGTVRFSLAHADTRDDYLYMTLYSSDMQELTHGSSSKPFSLYTQTVTPGARYYVKVDGDSRRQQFMIKANFTPYDNVEKENNNTAANATQLKNKGKYIGCISYNGDEDYYRFTAPSAGYVKISLLRYDISTDVQPNWTFTMYDQDMNKLYDLESTHQTDAKNTGNIYYVLNKGQSINMKVEDYSNTEGILYSMEAQFKSAKNIETEPNSEFSSADKLKVGTTFYGVVSEDNDYWTFKPAKTKTYKVAFALMKDVKYGYNIRIYDSSRNLVASNKNTVYKNSTIKFKAKKGKKYFVEISNANSGFFGGYSVGTLYKIKAK